MNRSECLGFQGGKFTLKLCTVLVVVEIRLRNHQAKSMNLPRLRFQGVGSRNNQAMLMVAVDRDLQLVGLGNLAAGAFAGFPSRYQNHGIAAGHQLQGACQPELVAALERFQLHVGGVAVRDHRVPAEAGGLDANMACGFDVCGHGFAGRCSVLAGDVDQRVHGFTPALWFAAKAATLGYRYTPLGPMLGILPNGSVKIAVNNDDVWSLVELVAATP